jgi:hypothetical protein
MGTRGSFAGGNAAGASPPSSVEVKEWVELYLHSPNTPSRCGAELKYRDFTFQHKLYDHLSRVLFNTTDSFYMFL